VHVAAGEHLGQRVTDELADAQRALRRAGSRRLSTFVMPSGHSIFSGVIIRESG
jgi:hypothetical protein